MRIATRLWIALAVTILVVLGAGVLIRVRHEQRVLLEVTRRDRRFFAVVLQTALSRPREGADPLEEARSLLAREEIAEAHIDTRLVSTGPSSSLPKPRLASAQMAPLQHGEVVVESYGGELLTYVPLDQPGVALELAERHAVDSLLTRIGWQSLWTQSLSLAALGGLVTYAIISLWVGRPLERLTELARQIGAGDFTARANVPRGEHEVAILAREMNGMAERLYAAHRAVEELGAERVAALEQLRHSDRLRTVGQLASALAHELGTPLNVVSGYARQIEQDPEVSADSRSSARTILEQTSRMTGIVKDLLSFARRKGKQAEELDLKVLAQRAARTLEPLTKSHNVNIRIGENARSVRVVADGQQLLQVLTNLLTNAMQAMPSGGVIDIELAELEVDPPTGVHAPKGLYARIAVTDFGVGIDEQDIPHLFEPFFTRKGEGEGTGLGLAVVEGIARDHQGWVSVRSTRGSGSTFEFFLPSAAAARA
jgi:two-component system, NtrC family, sensor kinase